jgi:polysaccharide pyruvyl transferase WcaK-like protein
MAHSEGHRMSLNVAIFNDTSGRGHYGADLVLDRLRHHLSVQEFKVAWTLPAGQDWREVKDDLARRPKVDAIIVNGEGSIHHSGKSNKSAFIPALGPFARDELKVPAFLINATMTELDEATLNDLRAFSHIYVRDTGTARELKAANITSDVVPDLTFSLDPSRVERGPGTLVTDSVRKSDSALLERFARKQGWPFHAMQISSKRRFLSVLRRHTSRMQPIEFVDLVSSHSFIVTGRLHTVTLALAAEVPFVSLESNTPKISWLLQDVFGNARRVVHPSELLKADFAKFTQWTPNELSAVRRFVGAAPERASRMLSDIRQAILAHSHGLTAEPAPFVLSPR